MSLINKYIIYLITASLILTIAAQLYWNYKNYLLNKQRITNEIRQSLNDAIDEYYSNLAKENVITIAGKYDSSIIDTIQGKILSNPEKIISVSIKKNKINSSIDTTNTSITVLKSGRSKISMIHTDNSTDKKNRAVTIYTGKKAADSLLLLKTINSIVISYTKDSIEYLKIDSIITQKLNSRNIQTQFILQHLKKGKAIYKSDTIADMKLMGKIQANSTFVKPNEEIFLFFQNPTSSIFKRGLIGIVMSILLSASIIFSLFYLLRIIRSQKQINEMKNDLISNITHEFKTPIATATTAIEALQNFNANKDEAKTEKYLQISNNQLKGLCSMVEKLLETASINSEDIKMKTERTDLVAFLGKLPSEFSLISDKQISFSSNCSEYFAYIDLFHFKNAVSNIIDNAIKYGGNFIEISLKQTSKYTHISIADNGKGIAKQHKDRIFDKFYRIPQGNKHNVKGFGIGLYYTNEIVKKHGATLQLINSDNKTVFRIELSNKS